MKAENFGALLLGALFVLSSLVVVAEITKPKKEPNLAASVVFVSDLNGGHGSGVYIGDNRFITAAHVVGDKKVVAIKTTQPDDKFTEEKEVEVAWTDTTRDVAMLVAKGEIRLETAKLSCGKPTAKVGTRVISIGYPLNMGLTQTWGRISGVPRNYLNPESAAQVADLTIAPGNSGGPVFEETTGEVLGLSQALMRGYGYAIIITRDEICAAERAHNPPVS